MKQQDIFPRNSKSQPHGFWNDYYTSGIYYKGQFINGLEHGYWIINRTMSKSKIRFYLT